MQDNGEHSHDVYNADISLFEEDVALQEATLETLTGQLQNLEKAMHEERSAYQENMEHLTELRSRQAKLQQSIHDNSELVKTVEINLRKTLESLRQKLVEATGSSNHVKRQKLPEREKICEIEKQSDLVDDDVDLAEFLADANGENITYEGLSVDAKEEKIVCEETQASSFSPNAACEQALDGELTNEYEDNRNVFSEPFSSIDHDVFDDPVEIKTVETLNSYMESRCWSGSLFANYIFKNSNLLLKILSIQRQELSDQLTLSTRKSNPESLQRASSQKLVRQRFVLGTCLDPISLLFQWHSTGKRCLLPWENEIHPTKFCDSTATFQQSEHQRLAYPWGEVDAINKSVDQEEHRPTEAQTLAGGLTEEDLVLDPNMILCPYDLAGLCIDTSCPYQHLVSKSLILDSSQADKGTRPKLQHLAISDETRFAPLPALLLSEKGYALHENKTDYLAAVNDNLAFQCQSSLHDSVSKHNNVQSYDSAGDDFVPLPIFPETVISEDSSSIGDDENDINIIEDTPSSTLKESSGRNRVPLSELSERPWWWPIMSFKTSIHDSKLSIPSTADSSFTFLLDDVIQIWSLDLNEFRNEPPLRALKLCPPEENVVANASALKLVKLVAGLVDLFRLCSSSGRIAEVSPILSICSRLLEDRAKQSSLFSPLRKCLVHIRRIERLVLNPGQSSTICDIFFIQQSLFLISEWLYVLQASHQNDSYINDTSGAQWENCLDSLLAETTEDHVEVNQSVALSFAMLQSKVNFMFEDFFSLSDVEGGDMKSLSILCRCKELSKNFAKLTMTLESPYFIPGFLEHLWFCISEREHRLAVSIQHRYICTMILIFPSIFQGLAALALESIKSDKKLPTNQDHRFYASLVSIDSLVHTVLRRVLFLHKSKTSFSRRQMFEGLLLAPCVALSASIAVELGFHAKAQRRIEHAFQRTLHNFGPSTADGVIYSSLLWSQLIMLQSCFFSLPQLADFAEGNAAILSKRLEDFGVCPSYVSLLGDSSLMRASGDFGGHFESLLGPSNFEKPKAYDLSLQPNFFVSLDGVLPSSILLFKDYLHSLKATHCHFHYLPESIGKNLCRLEVLDLSHNDLLKLPCSVCCIVTLRHLNVSYNTLCCLPSDIGIGLINLEVLNASYNCIKVLPLSIIHCSKLKVIDVSGNTEIQKIPRDLSLRLKDLHTLSL